MITSETAKNGPYNTNGSDTVFTYTFRIEDDDEIEVIKTDSTSLVDEVLTKTTDYTVSGVGLDAGGSITTVQTYASGFTITLRRKVPFTQTTDLQNQSAYFPDVVELALDKNTTAMQQLKEVVDRALVGNTTDVAIDCGTKRLINVVDPVNGQDAITLAYAAANLAVDVATSVFKSEQTATSGQTAFTVPSYVPGSNTLIVVVNNVWQSSAAYTETDTTTVTFTSGLNSGDKVEFRGLSLAGKVRKIFSLADEKASGTSGGNAVSGTWTARDIGTVRVNDISGASESSGTITLPAGTYLVEGQMPFYKTGRCQGRLKSITGTAVEIYGTSTQSALTEDTHVVSHLSPTKIVLTETTTLQFQYWAQSGTTDGLGEAASSSGGTEVYAQITIEEIS